MSKNVDIAVKKPPSLDVMVKTINATLLSEEKAVRQVASLRREVGKMLNELKLRVEADGHDWWQWQEGLFNRSRRDIERLLAIGKAPDPEAAAEAERARGAAQKRKDRHAARRHTTDKGDVCRTRPSTDPLSIPVLVEIDYSIDDKNERRERSLASFSGEIIALPAYYTREFGPGWERDFSVWTQLLTLVGEALATWEQIVSNLTRRAQPASPTTSASTAAGGLLQ